MTRPHEELARLYDEHAGALYAFLLSFTGQEADARDLLQELFIKLAASPALLAEARNERAFLLRTCYHLGVNWNRSRQVRVRHEAGFGEQPGVTLFATTDDPDTAVFRQVLSEALLDLPVEQRVVVSLKLCKDKPSRRLPTRSTFRSTPPPVATVTLWTNCASICAPSTTRFDNARS